MERYSSESRHIQALATYEEADFYIHILQAMQTSLVITLAFAALMETLFAQGGEGSPRWFFIPEHQPAEFDMYKGFDEKLKRKGTTYFKQ
jgi:hypothetical protein